MKSETIDRLEAEVAQVREFVEESETELRSSPDGSAHKIFLSSDKKLLSDLERQLREAKAERAHEVIRLRLHGTQLPSGTIQLGSLAKITGPLNALLEQSAWQTRLHSDESAKLDEQFSRYLDLRLAGLLPGSTELVILGNTAPDMTGDSALEDGLTNIFSLLSCANEELPEQLAAIGSSARKALLGFVTAVDSEKMAMELNWTSSGKEFAWDGRPAELTRLRTLIGDLGEPEVTRGKYQAIVNLLSVRGRLEIRVIEDDRKVALKYRRALMEVVDGLRLHEQHVFDIETTRYYDATGDLKREVNLLLGVEPLNQEYLTN